MAAPQDAPSSAPPHSSSSSPPRPIVGIGASAGGVGALREFFSHLPTEATSEEGEGEMAYVVILHLSPNVESNLAEILQEETPLPVARAEDGVDVTGGTVYVIPPGQRLTIHDGRLRVDEATGVHDPSSVDRFFRSLASDQGENAVGLVLSGSGSDGTLGLRAIKEAGGITMVQTPEEAEYESMPESALATGLVDLSLPVAQLAENLVLASLLHTLHDAGPQVAVEQKRLELLDRPAYGVRLLQHVHAVCVGLHHLAYALDMP